MIKGSERDKIYLWIIPGLIAAFSSNLINSEPESIVLGISGITLIVGFLAFGVGKNLEEFVLFKLFLIISKLWLGAEEYRSQIKMINDSSDKCLKNPDCRESMYKESLERRMFLNTSIALSIIYLSGYDNGNSMVPILLVISFGFYILNRIQFWL